MKFGFGGWVQRMGFSQSLVTGILGWELGNAAISNPMTSIVTNVGDTLLHSNAASASTQSTTYTKLKEVLITSWGYLRIKFTTNNSEGVADPVIGRIYKNGVAIGTERSNNTEGLVTYSEDFDQLKPGDLLQIYLKTTLGNAPMAITNFIFYWDSTGQTNPYTPVYINTLT